MYATFISNYRLVDASASLVTMVSIVKTSALMEALEKDAWKLANVPLISSVTQCPGPACSNAL